MKRVTTIILFLAVSFTAWAQIKVACVGNSITYGYGIEGRDSLAYPQQLDAILGEDWDVRNFGHSGATLLKNGNLPYWKVDEFQQSKDFMPDVVIIKLGTNDSKPINWDEYKDEYGPDYVDMIQTYENLKSHPVIFVGLPIPVVAYRWGIRKEIVENDIRTIIKNLATFEDVEIIDFYSVLENKEALIPDKIHPDAEGSRLMAEEVAKVLKDHQSMITSQE